MVVEVHPPKDGEGPKGVDYKAEQLFGQESYRESNHTPDSKETRISDIEFHPQKAEDHSVNIFKKFSDLYFSFSQLPFRIPSLISRQTPLLANPSTKRDK